MKSFLMFLLIVGGIVVVVVRRGLQMKKLVEHGVPVTGKVTDRKSRSTSTGGSATHHLRYEFTAPDGRTYAHRITVTGDEYQSFRDGDEIDLVYLPDNPKVSAQASMVELLRRETEKKRG